MGYEKLTEGNTEFCKYVETKVSLKSKATLNKELKDFLKKKEAVLTALTEEEANINEQLDVFKINET